MHFVVSAFEQELSKVLNSSCIATANGWSALLASLLALDIGIGDEVITTPFTFQATTNAIVMVGAIPVFVDIKESNSLINEELIQDSITNKTKAILPVHLFGRICNMPVINEIASKNNLFVIEDSAQSFLAKCYGKYAGTFGDVGCFSFYASKNLCTFEGGAVSVNGPSELEARIRSIISYGRGPLGKFENFGFNGRMSPQSAIIGLNQLTRHKNQIEYSIGEYSEVNGYYPYVTYQHDFIKRLGITGNCPIAEEKARCIANQMKS